MLVDGIWEVKMNKKPCKRSISTFKVAATYIGTVVGAGFASGQEILQFFSIFGLNGFFGLLIVSMLFVIFGYIIMNLGCELKSTSYLSIIKKAGGKYLGTIIDYMITFFLFGSVTAMIAGSGAIFKQQFDIPAVWGNLVMAFLTTITVLTGIGGVINSISFVVPFLMIAALGVSICSSIFIPPNYCNECNTFGNGLIRNWLWAAMLYASYNIILSAAVLGPLGNNARDKKIIKNGSILGGIGLGLGAAAIYFTLVRNLPNIIFIEVPMAFIAGRISYPIEIMYIIVLLAEIYTTAVGSLYGFSARIAQVNSSDKHYNRLHNKIITIFTAILAFITSKFGFSNLVSYLYPVMGYGGFILLICLLYYFIKHKAYKFKKYK